MKDAIDAVIVDTSAIMKDQSDFLGISSEMLPSFFRLLKERDIELISHPIIFEEVKKNICESALLKRLHDLKTALGKYKHVLPLVDISRDDVISKIDGLNLENKLVNAFEQAYVNATSLPYPAPKAIFDLYFSGKAPFSETGKKRHEFPDAFVIEAIKEYHKSYPLRVFLIIADDPDWRSAFMDVPNTRFADSVANGLKLLRDSNSLIPIIEFLLPQLTEQIKLNAESESYDLDTDPFFSYDDLEITDITVTDISLDITPLSITEGSALFSTSCILKVAGTTTVLDEDNSYWDKEESKYLFVKYDQLHFSNGEADIECEISITFDPRNPTSTASIESVKLIVQHPIFVEIGDDDLVYSDPLLAAEGDMMDTLEDFHRQ